MISPLCLFANAALLTGLVNALPAAIDNHDHQDITLPGNITEHHVNHVPQFDHNSTRTLSRRVCSYSGPKVHIMPAGDAYANGWPGQGTGDPMWAYRQELIRLMGTGENPISFVGSQHRGSGHNLQTYEAYWSSNVTEVREKVMPALPGISPTPDGVILNAGSWDIKWEGSTEKASDTPARMGSFLEALWAFNDNLVIVLSGLPWMNADEVKMNNRLWMNQEYRKLVDKYSAQGRKILYADVDSKVTADDIKNGYPDIEGYKKMASVFADSLHEAFCNGWFNS